MAKAKKDPKSPKPQRSNWVKKMKVIKENQELLSKLKHEQNK
jgi:hypothetical protein